MEQRLSSQDKQIVVEIIEQAGKLWEEGEVEKATEILTVGTTAFPYSVLLWNRLANVFVQQGNTGLALGYYLRAFEVDSGHRKTVIDCFQTFCRTGDFEGAMGIAAAYVYLKPEDYQFVKDLLSPQNNAFREDEWLNAGMKAAFNCHRAGDLKEAEKVCIEKLKRNSNNSDAIHLYGLIAYQRGFHRLAEHFIKQAIELDSDNPGFHNDLDLVLKSQRREKET